MAESTQSGGAAASGAGQGGVAASGTATTTASAAGGGTGSGDPAAEARRPAAYRRPSADRRPRAVERNLDLEQLLKYRLPTAGIVSILHRISGALLFLVGIPFVLYLFQKSITSELSFITYRNVVGSIPGKLVLIVLVWAFLHHLIAGFRYLALDLHIGIEKDRAAFSSKIVLAATGALTLICAIGLLFL